MFAECQAMELIDDAGSPPNLYVHLDTYHMNIEESSSEFAVGVCGDKLGYAQALLHCLPAALKQCGLERDTS